MNACESLPPDFSKHLHIDWTTALGNGGTNGRHSNWYWEAVNVLYCYALLYRKLAKDTLQAITENEYATRWTEVTKLLSTSAGIFSYISEHVASKFFVFPKDMPLPEVMPETYAMLSRLSLVECQEMAVKRSLEKESNPLMASQLSSACESEYLLISQTADKIQVPERPNSWLIKASARKYFDIKTALWRAISHRYMFDYHLHKQEPGIAIAYIEIAVKAITDVQPDVKSARLLNDANLDALLSDFDSFYTDLLDAYKLAVKDNDNIYHEIIRRERVSSISPKFLAKPISFTPPSPSQVSIQTKDSQGMFMCVIQ